MPTKFDNGLAVLAKRLATVSADAGKDFGQAVGSMRRAAATEAKRAASAVYNIKQARIAEDVSVTSDKTGVTITGKKRTISAISYGFKAPRGKPLRGQFIRGKQVLINTGFIAPALSGNLFPFVRTGGKRVMQKGRYAGKIRQNIRGVYGPTVADMLARDTVQQPLVTQVLGRAAQELRRRIARALRG